MAVVNGASRSSRIRAAGRGSIRPGAAPPGDRRDHRHLVAVGERRRRVGIVAVAREPERRATGSEDRVARDQGHPGVLDIGVVGKLQRDLARAGQLALDREETDPDPDRHRRPVSRATWR